MIAHNRDEIIKKTLYFWLLFVILIIVSLVPVYFFSWAVQKQKSVYLSKIQDYKNIINKQLVLQEQMDSLYQSLSYIDADKVENYLFLEKFIADQKDLISKQIGVDSNSHFSTYSCVLDRLNSMILLKDSLVKIRNTEDLLKRDLRSCMEKNASIRNSILRHNQLAN